MKVLMVLFLIYGVCSKMNSMNGMQLTAVEDDNEGGNGLGLYPQQYIKRMFTFDSPVNRCIPENCEFCCLSLNFCGTKEQCESSGYMMNIFRIMFLCVCSVLLSFLVYKIFITDSEPEHTDDDKIEEKSLNMLISIFMHNRENRKKFKI
jgi:hypothetical protein